MTSIPPGPIRTPVERAATATGMGPRTGRRRVLLLGLGLSVALGGCSWLGGAWGHGSPAPANAPQAPVAAPAPPVRVTLLHVNDVYQMAQTGTPPMGGLARLTTLREQVLKESPNTLLLLAGDTLGPSVASTVFKGRHMIEGWNSVGLDIAVLGNHEFDFGPEVLRQRMAESKFAWLGGNAIEREGGKPLAEPYVIRQFGTVRIGFVGVVTPDTDKMSKPGPGVEFRDPIATVRNAVDDLHRQGVKTVIALTHLTLEGDKELARAVKLDAVIGGHEHVLLQSFANGAPIIKVGSDAKLLGRLDLDIDATKGTVIAMDWHSYPVVAEIRPAPATLALVQQFERELGTDLDQPIGETKVALDARQSSVRSRETNLGNFLADAFRKETNADVALVTGGSIRSNTTYGPGKISKRDILAILPFENPILKLQVDGATLRRALEHALARAEKTETAEFPHVSGMRLAFDDTRPPGRRLLFVTVAGDPLEDTKTYSIALTKYVADGGAGFDMFRRARELIGEEEAQVEPTIAIAAFSAGPVAPAPEGRVKRRND